MPAWRAIEAIPALRDGRMSDALLDFAERDEKAGFRLENFELYNWGTFDARVWRLTAQARTPCSPATSARESPPWSTPSRPSSCLPSAWPTTRQPVPTPASAPCAPISWGTSSPSAARPECRPRPWPCATKLYSVDPRHLQERRIQSAALPGPGVLDQGPAGAAGSLLRRLRPFLWTSPMISRTSARISASCESACA